MLLVRTLESAGVTATVAGGACVLGMLLWLLGGIGDYIGVAVWVLPAVLIPGGAVVGAARRWLKGVTPREAAVFLDQRYGLREHLSTAAELAEASADDSPARCVYARALTAARGLPGDKANFWFRTRRTPAGLLLVMILCGVLLLFPSAGLVGRTTETERIITRLDAMSFVRRAAVAEAFRQAAGETKGEANQRNFASIAKAIEIGDDRSLRKLLKAMEWSGLRPREILSPELQRELGIASASEGRDTPAGRANRTESDGIDVPSNHTDRDTDLPRRVGVYHPDYAKSVRAPEKRSAAGLSRQVRKPATREQVSDPWRAVCARAGEGREAGKVPLAYRPIVRAFFRDGSRR